MGYTDIKLYGGDGGSGGGSGSGLILNNGPSTGPSPSDAPGGIDRVVIFKGSATGPASAPSTTIVSPDGASVQFGSLLATPLDANGDGYSDLVIAESVGAASKAYFFAGSATGLSTTATEALNASDAYGLSTIGN
ncbi:MAG: hypothetical protein ABI183_23015 [Polyangiaceae bacterium]